jgi:hypothetical protein
MLGWSDVYVRAHHGHEVDSTSDLDFSDADRCHEFSCCSMFVFA